MPTLLTQNGKIKKTSKLNGVRLYNFGIPALYSKALNIKTCPSAGICAVGCYARAGAYMFSNVAKVFDWRLEQTLTDNFIPAMIKELQSTRATHLRIHDSGDFYSAEYLARWLDIMRKSPAVQFYAYTKRVKMFKETPTPPNFHVIYSQGGKQDALIDLTRDRHSKVFPNIDALNSAGYTDCSVDDMQVLTATKIGLIYHGTKKIENTRWDTK